jgi:large subunit ribosomal protein L21
MAYAIIEIGGKQYRVEKGDSLLVDRLDAKEGAKVAPRALLYRSDDTVFDGSDLDKVKVDAVVVEHLRGPKIRVFKYRPKKRYRRQAGHRSALSRLEIQEIHGPAARKRAAGSAEAPKAAAGSGEGRRQAAPKREAAETDAPPKKAPAKKPAARKPAAAKKEG